MLSPAHTSPFPHINKTGEQSVIKPVTSKFLCCIILSETSGQIWLLVHVSKSKNKSAQHLRCDAWELPQQFFHEQWKPWCVNLQTGRVCCNIILLQHMKTIHSFVIFQGTDERAIWSSSAWQNSIILLCIAETSNPANLVLLMQFLGKIKFVI